MTRIAVVTGAARGIGAQIASRLAEDGCDVAVLDLDAEQCKATVDSILSVGRRAIGVAVDVTNESSVAAAVAEVAGTLGPPLILINNAGVMRSRMVHKMVLEDWELVMDVNLRGTFLMTREIAPFLRTEKWGRIVNLSSMGALGLAGSANYAAAKAGVQGLTKSLALELGHFNVTANAVAPGFVVTDMTRAIADSSGQSVENMEAEMASGAAVGRAGTPADIAQAVSFFVDERSSYVSGQVLYVAGGPKT
ncbi:3-oxoacyl-(acyl-carrier-protein) reductase [Luminiphilus syltensis NOR5-1B]|uniref:3-oxoacyl-(Acyl-carrier-protein) reductase n=1 Tax=Luminiphilus syltensis NOR5-1B TaxID=565045 RepID=B8KUH9_9GAMM|nr:SDR family oxidoreductase [Luminiphilus syltensis]EED36822.1 3-oxoacyl-(acyl-carrier-protein) reductase [Luminiphilus syltensis NOR5-1B]